MITTIKHSYLRRITQQKILPSMQSHISTASSEKRFATRIVRFVDENGQVRCGQAPPPSKSLCSGTTVELIDNSDPFGKQKLTGKTAVIKKLLIPIVPSQILGIGLNYRKHAQETKKAEPMFPIVFIKALNSLQDPEEPIKIPRIASNPPEVDYECELAVLVGKDCRNVSKREALSFVAGYTCANDVSARRWQGIKGGGQYSRAKSFDTFCPIGPVLVTPSEIPDPQKLRLSTRVNGELLQDSSTGDMIFDVAELISQLSQDTTLLKNTLILTGTPEGVGCARNPPIYLKPGDAVHVEIENIGILKNPVTAAAVL
uniref:Fumarylacetoacetate (FAA) hydrolase putative n=1 Tax=Albugo laibachii Nc14 TaxID=890382 RepID=F0WWZ2_9STRA|nr:fumarylacetoacetate (FAA) hydrolase putative [Albugo laibachii Nc14]|eukprot:CCA25978.1 fumarylacetoacetate (FAA) hydrolase putative [Albugo laibachii Nc14]